MNQKNKINLVVGYLEKLYPNARCELNYKKDYEFLISVMLSAQTTDKSVNQVTPILFAHFPTLIDLKNADVKLIERDIKSIGLYKNKARNIKEIARILVDVHGGALPIQIDDILSLPGVGNKTKNVVEAELFNIPQIAVDTHVNRVSKRLGFAKENDSVIQIEKKLRTLLRKDQYIKFNHQLIFFGRYKCKASHPNCQDCELKEICRYFKKCSSIISK